MTDPTPYEQDDRLRPAPATDRTRYDDPSVQDPQVVGKHDPRTSTSDCVEEPTRSGMAARHERAQLGGIRWGAVFFGWLCATGVAVLLIAIVAATGTAIGLTESTVDQVVEGAVGNASTISVGGAIALVVILAISYLAGGYVAARMARFSGRSQGFAVWVVGLVITILVALGGVLLGSAYDVLARLDLPRIPIDEGSATTGGVITLVAILVATLLAGVLGGSLGDRYHRRLDEIDLR